MARVLKKYQWKSSRGTKGRKPVYPWDRWLDGKIRRLYPQVDFKVPSKSFARIARTAAYSRGLSVSVNVEKGGTVVLQQTGER